MYKIIGTWLTWKQKVKPTGEERNSAAGRGGPSEKSYNKENSASQ